jgi:TetR/AcrR family transcriptional regulator
MMSDGTRMRRERDAEVARQAILEAAEEVFAENGFDGARIDAIAEASGYNKSLIFHYFGDKLGLYREIVSRVREHFQECWQSLSPFIQNDALPLNAGTVQAFLEGFIRGYFNMMAEHPQLARMFIWEAAEGWHTYVWSERSPEEVEINKSLINYYRRAQQAGLIDPELDPIQLIMNIGGLCVLNVVLTPLKNHLRDMMGEPAPDPAQIQEQIIRLVLHGALVPQSEGGEP